ncbi:uncharacterized protein LOC133904116 [Phragmites australis]|uniref:uncharacterized protein LOC133904116 n=1 Tax=Phragmites australis TaxID=29695 RepID=UPI002D7A3A5D|nr:uncharacterized protein LOC133904116 [Phragmites australis]
MKYVAELKRLWADLDHYDPIEFPHPECVAWVKRWIEKKRVLQFLRGLGSEFEAKRAAMFHQSNLPSLEEAIAAMAQEETRLKVMRGNSSPPPRPAFMVTGSQETRICYNCGEKGHLSRDCRQPFKPKSGRGRGSDRGGRRSGVSHGGGRGYKANLAMIEEGESNLVMVSAAELEELRKLKENKENSRSNDQETTTSNSDWISDSGASRHVTGKEDGKKVWDWSLT